MNLSLRDYFTIIVVALYVGLIWLMIGRVTIGGDVNTYWSIGTSFARGNYPTVLPWQPQYLTVYHEGAFIFEGALYAITKAQISIIHFVFSAYIVTALFLFLIGLAREKTRSLWSLIPSILGTVVYAGPVFLVGGFISFFQLITHSFGRNFGILAQAPHYVNMKMSIGAGVTSFPGFAYINFHTFALACFFLFIYLMFQKLPFLQKILVLITLCVVTLSIEEIFFPIELVLISYLFLKAIFKLPKNRVIATFLFSAVLFSILFVIVQNPVRDSLLTPSPHGSRFMMLNPFSPDSGSNSFMKSNEVNYQKSLWYLPDIRLMIVVLLLASIVLKAEFEMVLSLSALLFFFCGLAVENTFWSSNNLRFLTLSYNVLLVTFGFLLLKLSTKKKYMQIAAYAVLLCILPNIVISHLDTFYNTFPVTYDNYVRNADYSNPTLRAIATMIPKDARLLLIDNLYPDNSNYSKVTDDALTNYGLFVPTASPLYKVLNVDTGIEWYDAVMTLSPQAFQRLKINYVFIYDAVISRFSKRTQTAIKNMNYFTPIYHDFLGTLYQVHKPYMQLSSDTDTAEKMVSSIPSKKSVYLAKIPLVEIRSGLIVQLANRVQLKGPEYSIGSDYPMYVEMKNPPFERVQPNSHIDTDYIFADPIQFATPSGFVPIASMPHLALYKKNL